MPHCTVGIHLITYCVYTSGMDRGQTDIVKCTFYTDHFISCHQFYMLIADARFTAQTVDGGWW